MSPKNLVKECNRMGNIVFNELADYLRHGREIEFAYNERQYSITSRVYIKMIEKR